MTVVLLRADARAVVSCRAVTLFTASLLVGCATDVQSTPRQDLLLPHRTVDTPQHQASADTSVSIDSAAGGPARARFIQTGALEPVISPVLTTQTAGSQDGSYLLNFDKVDVRDVLKSVLAGMLHVSYTTDPHLQGTLSLNTVNPLSRGDVLPAFEQALEAAGIALVAIRGGYNVVPIQIAAQQGAIQLRGDRSAATGYRLEIIQGKYVTAAELQHLLEPITPPGTVVAVDPGRNLIVLAGTAADLARAEKASLVLDVDWLKNQSVGLFPLHYSDAKAVASDLNAVVGGHGPLAGLVRIVAIDHLNSILVASSRSNYVSEMEGWIDHFDRGRDTSERRLFVYHVQNGRAADLARVLTQALGGSQSASGAGQSPNPLLATNGPPPTDNGSGVTAGATGSMLPMVAPSGQNPLLGPLSSAGSDTAGELSDVRITADPNTNSLLVVAAPDKYRLIEAALKQLDTTPLEVLLEASVVEVDLTSDLRYGLQYYLRSGAFSALSSQVAASALVPSTGGLSVAFLKGMNIQGVLDLLSSITKVKVISAPKILALNNHTASLEVGDQVPVATSSAIGITTANAPIVNTIQLLDTGIILRFTPHVNAGGLVQLDLSQEVSSSIPTSSSSIDSPTIQQRKFSSAIAVDDGQTVALGGLISDNRTRNRYGIPWLMDVPYLGWLFGVSEYQVQRTELLVLITPHVTRNDSDLERSEEELLLKLPMIRDSGASHER